MSYDPSMFYKLSNFYIIKNPDSLVIVAKVLRFFRLMFPGFLYTRPVVDELIQFFAVHSNAKIRIALIKIYPEDRAIRMKIDSNNYTHIINLH
jgi:hypothetical protein